MNGVWGSKISDYNIVYNSPAKSDRSAMPAGNGETGASVWMTKNGTIHFYIARTDAVTELERTVKLGMAELSFDPPFQTDGDFRQTLHLEKGRIEWKSRSGSIEFAVGKNDVILIRAEWNRKCRAKAKYISWRNQAHLPFNSPCASSGLTEAADVVEAEKGSIIFYHKNGDNPIAKLAAQENLGSMPPETDLVRNRIFGGILELEGGTEEGGTLFCGPSERTVLKLATHSMRTENPEVWKETVVRRLSSAGSSGELLEAAEKEWEHFWKNSCILVRGDVRREPDCSERILSCAKEPMQYTGGPSRVTQGYLLTKYMQRCCGTGELPMFYNGLLFNLCPGGGKHLGIHEFVESFTEPPAAQGPDPDSNPDERSWSNEHLWQNLRLPYYTMPATGEFDSLRVLFRFFRRFQELNRMRAAQWYGARGQHNTEMTLLCGLQSEGIYGTDREGIPDGYSSNRWGGAIDISPGLELSKLMLTYYSYTLEQEFLEEEALPYIKELFEYIETRFPERENGKIVIKPLNCIETYFDTENPTPVVAGMHSVLQEIFGLPEELVKERLYFQHISEITPEIPTETVQGERVIAPARVYEEKRQNVEAPELYAVYPFGLYSGGSPEEEKNLMLRTFGRAMKTGGQLKPYTLGENPGAPSWSGWQYVGNAAAMLNKTELVREILETNCALQNPGNRFPAMWGPIYDSVPDVDHGANIMNLLQLMILRCEGRRIYVLPAFPADWDVKFRLYAPHRTVVEGEYEGGRLKRLQVWPEERKNDIVLPDWMKPDEGSVRRPEEMASEEIIGGSRSRIGGGE